MRNFISLQEIILSDNGVIISRKANAIAVWEIGQSWVNFYEQIDVNEYLEMEPMTNYALEEMDPLEVNEYLEEKLSERGW